MERSTHTRQDDDPVVAQRIRNARREGRKWTIIYATIAAGLVSLFIGRAIEVQSQNDQVDRNRINCQLIQDDRLDRLDSLREQAAAIGQQADNILGNKKPLVYVDRKPVGKLVVGKPIPKANFDKPPYAAFESFKPLILAQAKQNRASQVRNVARSKKVAKRIEDCKKVFPKKKPFWIL